MSDEMTAAWARTVEEMEALAADREANGWETLTLVPGDTAPTPPAAGDSDRFGLVYTVSGSDAEPIERLVETTAFTRYNVYRRQVGEQLFLVTEVQDTDRERALFVAGAVTLSTAEPLVQAAADRNELYSHFQLLDWTHLGSVRHDDPAAFFPQLA